VQIQIGSFRAEIGRRPSSAVAIPGIELEKKLPPGAVVTRDLTEQAKPSDRTQTGGAPAAFDGPQPGPLPTPTQTDRQPFVYQFPYGSNQYVTPGRGKVAPFAVLRNLARYCDYCRIAIETRKDQLSSLVWDIVPTDKQRQVTTQEKAAIARAKAFFKKPDRRRPFQTWLRLLLEEMLVTDALSIHKQRTRKGELYALRIIDGGTILPLIDADGDTPLPPNIAYRQIINGQPVKGGDCTSEQLMYRPRTVAADTPYGLSPTEAVLLSVNAALQRRLFPLSHYSEGNVPAGLMSVPENWTTKQIAEFQIYWDDLMAGNALQKSRIKFVGKGMAESYQQTVDPDFTTEFDEFLLKVVAASYAVTPAELGFTADINKSTGDSAENITYRRGVRPAVIFLKEVFNEVLPEFGLEDFEWQATGGEPEDKKLQAEIDEIYLARGVYGLDDVRARLGFQPIGVGPMIDTPMGPIPIEQLLAENIDDDPDTSEINTPASTEGDAATEVEAQRDMKFWRQVAIKAVKSGRKIKPFSTDAISVTAQMSVRAGLADATTVEDVVKVFDQVSAGPITAAAEAAVERSFTKGANRGAEYRQFVGMSRVALAKYRRHFSKSFTSLGQTLGANLAAAVAGTSGEA
jgi:hypothetical protein